MTLISAFTIGVPSFVLALEPNHDRIKGHFLTNVIVRSIPSAVVIVIAILVINIIGYNVFQFDYGQISTMCVLTMSIIGFMLVIRLSIPFTPIRIGLIIVIVGGTILGCVFFGNLFNIAALVINVQLHIIEFLYDLISSIANLAWGVRFISFKIIFAFSVSPFFIVSDIFSSFAYVECENEFILFCLIFE